MQRQDKIVLVDQLARRLAVAKAAFVTEYRGLTVAQITALRGKMRAAQGTFHVVKNRLAKRALGLAPKEGVEPHLCGPTALALAEHDAVPVAKVLVDFAKDHEVFRIKGGYAEGRSLILTQIQALAQLPSRPALYAQLLGVMQGTARGLAGVLAAVPRGLVTALQAIADQKGKPTA